MADTLCVGCVEQGFCEEDCGAVECFLDGNAYCPACYLDAVALKGAATAIDPLTRVRIVGAITQYDAKLCASEAKKGQRVNLYRLSILLKGVDSIALHVAKGVTLREAILRVTCGRVTSAILKGIGERVQTVEEARAHGH